MKKIIFLLMFVYVFTAVAYTQTIIIKPNAKIRESHTAVSKVIKTIHYATIAEILSKSTGYYKIKCKGTIGYVNEMYCDTTSIITKAAVVKISSGAKLRKMYFPYEIIKTINYATNVQVLSKIKNTGYYKIKYDALGCAYVNEIFLPEKWIKEYDGVEKEIFEEKWKKFLENYFGEKNYTIESIFKGSEPKEMVQRYVDYKVKLWQQKGEFEKTENYLKRIGNRSEHINACKDEAELLINGMWITKTDWNANRTIFRYDADSETFKIVFQSYPPLILKVPISEAKNFKANFEDFGVIDAKFNYINGEWGISYLELKNPVTSKLYTYDVSTLKEYNPTEITYNFDEINIELDNIKKKIQTTDNLQKISVGKPDVDVDIPLTTTSKPYTYALIIGNEDYSKYQKGLETEADVPFALNDARVFALYCEKTLGIPKKQIKLVENATSAKINQNLAWISNLAKIEKGKAELIFYYSGHGLPHEKTKEAYLIPVDVAGTNLDFAIKLSDVYKKLTENPTKQTTVFLDACFSGGAKNEGLLAMKGIKVKPKENFISGNLAVFTSSSGDESSNVYDEKQHGYFTYFLLKKLQETKGEVGYENLSNYIIQSVQKEAGLEGKKQTPQINVSPKIESNWKNWKLR